MIKLTQLSYYTPGWTLSPPVEDLIFLENMRRVSQVEALEFVENVISLSNLRLNAVFSENHPMRPSSSAIDCACYDGSSLSKRVEIFKEFLNKEGVFFQLDPPLGPSGDTLTFLEFDLAGQLEMLTCKSAFLRSLATGFAFD
jgi:hypothetical protein